MARLYELVEAYENAIDAAVSASGDDGQVPSSLADLIDAINDDIDTKFERSGYVLANLKGLALGVKAERDRLSNKLQAIERAQESLKKYLQEQMQRLGETKRQAGIWKFGISKNGGRPAVFIEDERMIPISYWIDQEPKLDREAIIKNGGCTGVRLERGTHLSVT